MGILIIVVVFAVGLWAAFRAKPQTGYVASGAVSRPSQDLQRLYLAKGFHEDLKWNWVGGRSLALDTTRNKLAYFSDPHHKGVARFFKATEIRAVVVFANKKPLFWHSETDGQSEFCIRTYQSPEESVRIFKLILNDPENYHRINLVIFSRDQIEMDFIDTATPIGSQQSEAAIERAKEWLLLIASLMAKGNSES